MECSLPRTLLDVAALRLWVWSSGQLVSGTGGNGRTALRCCAPLALARARTRFPVLSCARFTSGTRLGTETQQGLGSLIKILGGLLRVLRWLGALRPHTSSPVALSNRRVWGRLSPWCLHRTCVCGK